MAPANWMAIDTGFPSFTGEESPKEQIQALHNYLFMMREGLQYSLQNLSAENFNPSALQNLQEGQKDEVAKQLEKVLDAFSQLSSKVDGISARVEEMGKQLSGIAEVLTTDENGNITLGAEGKQLHLVGTLYINGEPYEQGGTE